MSALIDIQEVGDIVYTMHNGVLRSWKVQDDGAFIEVDPMTTLS